MRPLNVPSGGGLLYRRIIIAGCNAIGMQSLLIPAMTVSTHSKCIVFETLYVVAGSLMEIPIVGGHSSNILEFSVCHYKRYPSREICAVLPLVHTSDLTTKEHGTRRIRLLIMWQCLSPFLITLTLDTKLK